MGATRAKTEYLTKVRLERFLSVNLPNCWLVTMSFHENVIVKKEAMKRWKPVVDWLRRHGIDWCGVWQQQKRGARHHHFLINKYINVVSLREFVVARGWGQFVNVEAVGQQHGGRRSQDAECVVKYLTRYLTRGLCGHVPIRVRLTSGRADNKVGTTRFNWVGSLARVWRTGCSLPGYQPKWNDYKAQRNLWRRGCLRLGLSYVEVMQRLLGLGAFAREEDSS
jgi:hypothetical protein